ncbi:CAAX prenyl protease 1 homolog [Eupeodes corollae]|uniref:CAAX prenyl protease 1 homolog n=1 Tax=Eupeodes corollae TaxID=290404 RepID=UPI0024922CAC|nr:CAAX prenyl protease 1 homolog [Eupeodes corollae]
MDQFINADVVLYGILSLIVLENALEIYISSRQVKVYKNTKTVPKELENVMNEETFHKARLYGLDREQFGIFKAILMDVMLLTFELYFGFIAYLWEKAEVLAVQCNLDPSSEIVVSCLFLAIVSTISVVKGMPFKVYKTFVLEEKHGFNKQTAKFFVIDQIKGFIVSQVISTPIVAAIVFIVQRGGEHFFIWLWLFTGIVSLVLLTIHPIFIAPLFDKYTPLEDGPLRESIENLAASLKFPLTKLYVVDGSKRSAHSNAYFYGLWSSKRIVLFDTLLLNKGKKDDSELKEEERGKGCTDEEVLAVLGHELGHWKLGHITKNIVIIQVHLLLMFAAFGYLFQYGPFYEAVGFKEGQRPILVGLLVVMTYVMAPYNALINFGMTMLSRKFEYEADEFAQKLGFSELLSKALIKLNLDNLGFPVYDWLYSSWNHSHPTLLQRMNRIKELDDAAKKTK